MDHLDLLVNVETEESLEQWVYLDLLDHLVLMVLQECKERREQLVDLAKRVTRVGLVCLVFKELLVQLV